MKKTKLAMLVSLVSLAAAVQAQAPSTEIRESTDPAKAAEVEQRAAEIQARQQSAAQDATSGSSGTEATKSGMRAKSKKPMGKSRKGKAADDSSGAASRRGDSDAGQGADSEAK